MCKRLRSIRFCGHRTLGLLRKCTEISHATTLNCEEIHWTPHWLSETWSVTVATNGGFFLLATNGESIHDAVPGCYVDHEACFCSARGSRA